MLQIKFALIQPATKPAEHDRGGGAGTPQHPVAWLQHPEAQGPLLAAGQSWPAEARPALSCSQQHC